MPIRPSGRGAFARRAISAASIADLVAGRAGLGHRSGARRAAASGDRRRASSTASNAAAGAAGDSFPGRRRQADSAHRLAESASAGRRPGRRDSRHVGPADGQPLAGAAGGDAAAGRAAAGPQRSQSGSRWCDWSSCSPPDRRPIRRSAKRCLALLAERDSNRTRSPAIGWPL